MLTPRIRTGDLLFYHRVRTAGEALIDLGATLEDGQHTLTMYHIAIALGPYSKIEAIMPGGVHIAPILYDGTWTATRPPLTTQQINRGIAAAKMDIGQHYDKVLIVDDGLRDISCALFHSEWLHLPEWLVHRSERLEKICSTLVNVYAEAAPMRIPRVPGGSQSPQDWWLATREYQIQGSEVRG